VSRHREAKDRLIVPLDVPDLRTAGALVEKLAGRVGMFKVGLQLFTVGGPDVVKAIVDRGERVFLDLKFHDIPNTVAGAVDSAVRLRVSLLTIHGSGGRAMLEAAVRARGDAPTRLLAVTVLTSHDQASLAATGVATPLPEQVRRLAALAKESGVDGVVASPHEVGLIREAAGPELLVVTPGIRPAGSDPGDQARAATPATALAAGSDYLVVGRPIIAAPDPAAAAAAIVREIEHAVA
jgi:orotidine-5'-phosphate decarboxylase